MTSPATSAPLSPSHPPEPSEPGQRFGAGKVLISLVALIAGLGAFLADWNATHIYNPDWPPHAKFHNGQTMNFGVLLAAGSLFFLWLRREYGLAQLRLGVTFAALYWVAQVPAILYPGAALYDPEHAGMFPVVLGLQINQLVLDVVFFALLAAGYALERRRLRRVLG